MSNPTELLQGLLDLEKLDTLLFRGETPSVNKLARVYGGQVLAQSLNAAIRTVPEERFMHSMHAYFLRPGDVDRPIIFEVDPIRDGGSFTTRRVVAKQQGKAIFSTSVSFKLPEKGLEHNDPMPNVPTPETLPSDESRYKTFMAENPGFKMPQTIDAFQCFDVRTVGELPLLAPKGHPTTQGFWIKPKYNLDASYPLHQTFLAYISDMRLMLSAILPHGLRENLSTLMTASLDHSLWIHNVFDMNDWHYCHLNGPVSAGGCGLNFGKFYSSEGKLIASTSQEGLMRVMDSELLSK